MREDRIARNEVLYRELNERVNELKTELSTRGVVEQEELSEYFCECGLDDCQERIHMTPEEYETVRANPARFAIFPEHLIADVERVVDSNERFNTVEKFPPEQALAIDHDPRSR